MFWNDLQVFGQIYFVIACVATVVLIVQLVLLIIGISGVGDMEFGDAGVDFDGDSDGGIGLFTIKGLVGFFAIAGWVGVACQLGGLHEAWSVVISTVFGLLAFVGIGYAYKAIKKLQANGAVLCENAIGKIGEVYLTIPEKNAGKGKISIIVQGKLSEMEAITDEEEPIMTGRDIIVLSVSGDTCKVSSDTNVVVEIPNIDKAKKKRKKK